MTMPHPVRVTEEASGARGSSAAVQNGWSLGAPSMRNAFIAQYGEPAEL
jgi:hypothetical protein